MGHGPTWGADPRTAAGGAGASNRGPWWLGRTDPSTAPAGYRGSLRSRFQCRDTEISQLTEPSSCSCGVSPNRLIMR